MNQRALRALLLLLPGLSALTIIAQNTPHARQPILEFIRETWRTLTRSNATLAASAADPKLLAPADGRCPVYISAQEDHRKIERQLRGQMTADAFREIELRVLAAGAEAPAQPGLLYLPHPYVVPGGRFNEMYGWDSFFIQMGLLRDGLVDLARDMADNFIYQVDNYGKVLNANRTYYLTRSQPPFLS